MTEPGCLLSSQPFVIEEVRNLDAAWPELEALLRGIIEYHQPFDPKPLRKDWSARMFAYMAPNENALTLLARWRGQAVGFLSGGIRKDYGIFDEVYAYIDNAFVREAHRGEGIGHALLNQFETWSRQQGAIYVRLNVNAANELGRKFWTDVGFTVSDLAMIRSLGATS